jgi:hypothetical protein
LLGYAKRIRVADEQVNPRSGNPQWVRGSVCRKDAPRADAPDGMTINAAAATVAAGTQKLVLTTD